MILVGARGELDIDNVLSRARENTFSLQILDAAIVCGREHIEVAFEHACRAFNEHRNTCDHIEMELLRYVAGERQIKDAIRYAGAKEQGTYAFTFFDTNVKNAHAFIKNLGLAIDDNVLEITEEKIASFVDLDSLKGVDKSFYSDVAFEKIALVDIVV